MTAVNLASVSSFGSLYQSEYCAGAPQKIIIHLNLLVEKCMTHTHRSTTIVNDCSRNLHFTSQLVLGCYGVDGSNRRYVSAVGAFVDQWVGMPTVIFFERFLKLPLRQQGRFQLYG